MTVENMLGEVVYKLEKTNLPGGLHRIGVETAGWASGIYMVTLNSPDGIVTSKLVKR